MVVGRKLRELLARSRKDRRIEHGRKRFFESLETRQLLAHVHAIYAPGTSAEYMANHPDVFPADSTSPAGNEFRFQDSNRWSRTATDGAGLQQGDPTTLTWSIVRDGTALDQGTSNLVAFLDGIYGGGSGSFESRPWFPLLRQVFDRWSAVSGVNFVYEPNDDIQGYGLATPGTLGVRGDVRLGGRSIDGNFGILGYNFFPDYGDLVLDTGDLFYQDISNNSLHLRNVLAHESGHGLGIDHVCPDDKTKLMEPIYSDTFDGPQEDDILAVNRGYGDRLEPNDATGQATPVATSATVTTLIDNVSIDGLSDRDLYRVTAGRNAVLSVSVTPLGSSYLDGPQNSDGTCSAGTLFNALAQTDLRVEILDTDGSTVLASANARGPGGTEAISNVRLPGGNYYVRVSGLNDRAQMYSLGLSLSGQPAGPKLISVNPNEGDIFQPDRDPGVNVGLDNTLHVAPRELTFRFDGGAVIDNTTLDGIRITRSGGDGIFGNVNDVTITPGFIGLGETPRIVVARFAETLPDDLYRLEVLGVDNANLGLTGLKDQAGNLFVPTVEGTDRDTIFFDLDLGAQITAIVPQPVTRVQRVQLTGTVSGGSFRLTFAGETTASIPWNADGALVEERLRNLANVAEEDVFVTGPSRGPWEVTFRGRYAGEQVPLLVTDPSDLTGASAPGVSAQATSKLSQARDQIIVYFNDDNLRNDPTSATNRDFYQLILTKDTVSNQDDVVHRPVKVAYYPEVDKAVLTFSDSVTPNPLDVAGTYRLRIGTDEPIPAAPNHQDLTFATLGSDIGSSFVGARNLNVLGTTSQIISSQIDVLPYGIEFPGAIDQAGHRDIPFEFHYYQNRDQDALDGEISVERYNFRNIYGYDPFGNPLQNAITEAQKQRTREIFALFSQYTGIQFIETTGSEISDTDITIATGDLRALNVLMSNGAGYPYALNGTYGSSSTPTIGTEGRRTVILDNAEQWYDGFGDDVAGNTLSWFEVAMGEIGNILGLGHTYDLPGRTLQGDLTTGVTSTLGITGETVYPGDDDIVHGQWLYRPESNDIDMYRFTVSGSGLFTAETFAERLPDSSLLDTNLRLYRQNADGTRELISQNDDYFSNDSYIELLLQPGTYYVGISASGNNDYDPTIDDSGIGGRSQGNYDLRLNFRPNVSSTIVDATGTALDGDLDGVPGGVHNFWFQSKPLDRALEVTAAANAFPDTKTMTLVDAQGITRVFEFNRVGGVSGSNREVNITNPLGNATYVRDAIVTAINLAGFGVTASAQGVDRVILSGDRRITLDPAIVGVTVHGKTVFVDKTAAANADGSLLRPFNNIANPSATNALANVQPGDIVRIVGNGGIDGNLNTEADSFAYEIGFGGPLNPMLSDGSIMNVPQGVTVMIDSGAVFKLRQAGIIVGSSTASVNRSGASIQVLGTPVQDVFFTSYNDETLGFDTNPNPTTGAAGDWGGIAIRHDVERAQGRFVYEKEGIFLNYVNHADIRYGGGSVYVDSVLQTINPVDLAKARPAVTFNTITHSAQAAIAADPDSFEETNFHTPQAQFSGEFTSDYDRVGPHVRGNRVSSNSNNGLFVRVQTPAGNQLRPITVAARFDDTDITHIISQNLVVQGTPGGPIVGEPAPPAAGITLVSQPGGSLAQGTAYSYRLTFVDAQGYETSASAATNTITISTAGHNAILLANLPPASSPFVARRLYRSNPAAPPGTFVLVTQLDASTTVYRDAGKTAGGTLSLPAAVDRPRLDARLAIDAGTIVKLESSRIDTTMGGQFLAEARDGMQIVFTSRLDDRYGAAGAFDTNNDAAATVPARGNWGGLFLGQMSKGSIDFSLITFGGGITPIEGAFAGFNPIEVHQADVRLTNSIIENNANGTGGNAESHRLGRGSNAAAAVFVRGAQPVVVGNTIRTNAGSAIHINVNSLNSDLVRDLGRSRGPAEKIELYGDNQGPLVRENKLASNSINGMEVRGGILTTEGVWDDTDIVHVVRSEVVVPDFHAFGGLRLESSATESLVVKLSGGSTGFTSTGRPLDIDDRIGGALHIVGQPGFPVILSALADDSVGSGFDPYGIPQTDTNGNGSSSGAPGAWRGILIDQYSHDRNVESVLEREAADAAAPGVNATPTTAQFLGALASGEKSSDDNLRLGFEIQGYLNEANDIDVYSFLGISGTEVWFDIDRTTHSLDTVVELIDATGQIIAQTDDSGAETAAGSPLYKDLPTRDANILQNNSWRRKDDYTTNPRDAGFRVVLPGTVGETGTFHVRVRSSNLNTGDPSANLQNDALLGDGLTSGVYQLQIRLRGTDEVPGSTVHFADIRYATVGIEVNGMPIHTPLAGEVVEDNSVAVQDLGNLLNTDRAAVSISGDLTNRSDTDSYQFQLRYDGIEANYNSEYVSTVFDIDYADGIGRPDTSLWVFDSQNRLVLRGKDSNIAGDRPAALNGADLDDLARGSTGELDPYIGPVMMPEGTYTVVVTSNGTIPQVMDQFLGQGVVNNYYDPASSNPLLRLEPIDSVARIAEDRMDTIDSSEVVDARTVPVLFDTTSPVPYTLGDVVLFVSQLGGLDGGDESSVYTVNPFTGMRDTTLGDFEYGHGDIAMRPEFNDRHSELEGTLWTFSTYDTNGNQNDGTVQLRQLSTGDANILSSLDDGIVTYRDDPNAAGLQEATADVGFQFNAMTFVTDTGRNLWAVGNRSGNLVPGAPATIQNVLYYFDADSGAAQSFASRYFNQRDRRTGQTPMEIYMYNSTTEPYPAATQIVERGILDINSGAGTPLTGPGGNITGMAYKNGVMYVVSDQGGLYTLNNFNGTGTFGESVTATYVQTSAHDLWGIQFQGLAVISDTNISSSERLEGTTYQDILFAIDTNGNLYAFNTAGQLRPVFVDGQTRVPTGIGNARGLAFSTLTSNLWKTTQDRHGDAGHGVDPAFDNSRWDQGDGHTSYYFGSLDGNSNSPGDNHYDFPGGAHGSLISNEISLKGYAAEDQPMLYFSYFLDTEPDANDYSPTVPRDQRDTFRVFVSGDDGNWTLLGTNNSFQSHVYFDEYDIGTKSDYWTCEHSYAQVVPCVYPLFNNTGGWRQARIPLGAYAGEERVRLRFEFSSAGAASTGSQYLGGVSSAIDRRTAGDDLRALPGHVLRDGQSFTISNFSRTNPNVQVGTQTFEFDLGYTLVAPSGANIDDLDSFTVDPDGLGPGTTFTFVSGVPGLNEIQYSPTDTPAQVAVRMQAALAAAGLPLTMDRQGHRLNLIDGDPTTLMVVNQSGLPATFVEGTPDADVVDDITDVQRFGRVLIRVNSGMDRNEVAKAIQQRLGDIYSTTVNREVEVNDTRPQAQNLDLLNWTRTYNQDIANPLTTPHVTVTGFGNSKGRLFAVPGNNLNRIVELDPQTGAELNGFASPAASASGVDGLAFDGTSLWFMDGAGTTLYELNPNTGAIIDSDPITAVGTYDSIAAIGGTNRRVYLLDAVADDIQVFHPTFDIFLTPLDIDLNNPGLNLIGGLGATSTSLIAFDGTRQYFISPTTGLVTSSFASTMTDGGLTSANGELFLGSTVSTIVQVRTPTGSFVRNLFLPYSAIALAGGSGTTGDVDYYSFTGTSGSRAVIDVDDATTSPTIRLYNSVGTLIGGPTTFDLVIPALPADDTYFVEVSNVANLSHYTLHVSADDHAYSGFGSGNAANFKVDRDLVKLVNHNFISQDPGQYNGQPLGVDLTLAGDVFGAFDASFTQEGNGSGSLKGMDNVHQGAWIDDVIIGLAERGEMVVNANQNPTFIDNTELLSNTVNALPHNEILVGEYQLEIRRGEQYAAWNQTNPVPAPQQTPYYPTSQQPLVYGVANFDGPDTLLFKTIDSNERMDQQSSLVATPVVTQEVEFNGTQLTAQNLELLTWTRSQAPGVFGSSSDPHVSVSGNISLLGAGIDDYDYYSFSARPGDLIRVDIDDANIQAEFVAYLLNPFGSAVAITNLTVNPEMTVNLSPTAPAGTYYVVILMLDGPNTSENYTLHISDRDHTAGTMGSMLYDGQLFQVSDGVDTVVFEFNDADLPLGHPLASVAQGHVAVPFRASDTADMVASSIRDAINSPQAQANLNLVAALSDETVAGTGGTSTIIDLVGNAVGDVTGSFDFGEISARVYGTTADQFNEHGYNSDSNRFRDQGQILIQSNRITDSLVTGIRVDDGSRTRADLAPMAGSLPHAGPPKNFSELNTQRLAPGVTIFNNVVAGSGFAGIEFRGDPNAQVPGVAPFGRIVNNTVYGSKTDDHGILVDDNASPTVLNNILSNVQFGITVGATSTASTVLGANLYDPNVPNNTGLGTFPIIADPRFVDATRDKFYLRAGSKAIDSSLDSLDDRADYATRVKAPLGIAASPILAPERDAVGQLRADDPSVNNAGPQGANVFKDRGALDRSDFIGPTALLINPFDNDTKGTDQDASQTVVKLIEGTPDYFAILLVDGEGTGPDPDTVTSFQVTITEDGHALTEGVDYRFGFNATNRTIRLTPLSGVWKPGRTYEITLNNRDRFVVAAPAGDQVADGDQFRITDPAGTLVVFEYESGYSITVPETLSLTVPPEGADSGGIRDGDTFDIYENGRLTRFEFDSNSNFVSTNIPIAFLSRDPQDVMAGYIIRAIDLLNNPPGNTTPDGSYGLNLSPRYLGSGVIHLGVRTLADLSPQHDVRVPTGSVLTTDGQRAGIDDGQSFVLHYGYQPFTFEFDSDGSQAIPGSVPIPFTRFETHLQIADDVVAAVAGVNSQVRAALALDPTHLRDGQIHLDGTAGYVVDTASSVLKQNRTSGRRGFIDLEIPAAGAIADGDKFTIRKGTAAPVTFEFDSNYTVALGSTAISLIGTPAPTAAEMAQRVKAALEANGKLGLSQLVVTVDPSGLARVTMPAVTHNLQLTSSGLPPQRTSLLTEAGEPGVVDSVSIAVPANGGAGIVDGSTFSIRRGTNAPVTFEFNEALDGNTTLGNVIISFSNANTDRNALAQAIVNVINGVASLGLRTESVTGTGIIRLNETANYQLTIPPTTALTRSGIEGGAVPVVYVPDRSFTGDDMAGVIINAINFSDSNVFARLRAGSTIFLSSPTAVSGIATVAQPGDADGRLDGIKDLAGNDLQPNRPNNETQFTIMLPGAELDYGDAPETGNPYYNVLGGYPTVESRDGARHVVVADSIHLGAGVDADPNGQPNATATGDDQDYTLNVSGSNLTFTSGSPFSVRVPASGGTNFVDKQVFVLDGLTFEFDDDALAGTPTDNVGDGVAGTNKPIVFRTTDSQDVLADKIVAAVQRELNAKTLKDLTPANLGAGRVFLGGQPQQHSLNLNVTPATPLSLTGQLPATIQAKVAGLAIKVPLSFAVVAPANVNMIDDGETFTISDGVNPPVTFEYNKSGTLNNTLNREVNLIGKLTQKDINDQVFSAIQDAVSDGDLAGLSPSNLGGDLGVSLGATAETRLVASNPLRRRGPVFDEVTFQIDPDGPAALLPVTFEFDEVGGVSGTNVPVSFVGNAALVENSSSASDIANALVSAINGQFAGINARNLGNAVLELSNATIQTFIPLASGLSAVGQAGGIADGQTFTLNDQQQTITFEFDRNGQVTLGNVAVTLDNITSSFVTTSSAGVASAMAAAIAGADAQLTVALAADTVTLSQDDEDGVTILDPLNQYLDSRVTVVSSGPGLLDAWIDYNRDGDWDDFAEKVFDGVALSTGANDLTIRVPSFAQPGRTFARFRLSAGGGLFPKGIAIGGEVEDYLVTVIAGTPPVSLNDSYTTTEDLVKNQPPLGVLVNDTDTEGNPLSVYEVNGATQAVGQPVVLASGATLTLAASGQLNYDPRTSTLFQSLRAYNPADPTTWATETFTYRANDNPTCNVPAELPCASMVSNNVATVTMTIQGVNDVPVAVDDTANTTENTSVGVDVIANDTDADINTVLILKAGSVQISSMTLDFDGSGIARSSATATQSGNVITFNPGTDFDFLPAGATATVIIDYVVEDNAAPPATDAGKLTITVTGVNDAPLANPDSTYTIAEDTKFGLTISAPGVLANDSDVEGDALTARPYPTQPSTTWRTAHGTVTLNANGGFQYTPDANFFGSDFFTYTAFDGAANSAPATVAINVTPVNDPPTAADDGQNGAYPVDEDTVLDTAARGLPGVLANDNDVDGDVKVRVVAQPANGVVSLDELTGAFIYSPTTPNFNGLEYFTYEAWESTSSNTALATVTITVNAVNDAPVAVNDSGYSVDEDGVLDTAALGRPSVLANDTDVDNVPPVLPNSGLTAAIVSQPAHGTLSLNANGSFIYVPSPNFNGTDSFTYRANDGSLNSNVATVIITVNPVNDGPSANPDSYTTNEDTALVVPNPGVLGNDNDFDGDVTAQLLTPPTKGTVILNPNGSFEYSPLPDANGIDTFTYTAVDSNPALNSTSTVTIAIRAVNDAPVAVDDNFTVAEDAVLAPSSVLGLLKNDSDVDRNKITVSFHTDPSHGTLTVNPNGSFTYTPQGNYHGSDSFTYRITDGDLESNTATATITVTPVNDAPVAANDSYTINEDVVLDTAAQSLPGVLANDTDFDGDTLRAVLVAGVSHGTLSLANNGSFIYTPQANYNGADSFTYRANDGALDSGVVTVTITIRAVNDAPVAVNDSYATNQNQVLTVAASKGVLINDTDVEGSSLQALLVSAPLHGAVSLAANGSFVYTPNTGYYGFDTFTYKATDGAADSNTATVTIKVNARPVAQNDGPYIVGEGGVLVVAGEGVLFNDTDLDGDPLKAILVSGPTHGTLTLNDNGLFTYTPNIPNTDYSGPDSFTYKANDGVADSNVATVTIVVTPVPDAPVAVNDDYTVSEDGVLDIGAPGVLGNDSDADGDALTASLVASPPNGTVTMLTDGSFVYTPKPNFSGTDSFTYRVKDATNLSATGVVTVHVTPQADAPIGVADSYAINAGATLTGNVLQNDLEVDGETLEAALVPASGPQHGSLTLNADGSFTYVPVTGFRGLDGFQYIATDSTGLSTAPVQVTIAVKDPTPWQNSRNPLDVNNDGFVSAIDALQIINQINKVGQGTPLPPPIPGVNAPPPYYDVNGDNLLTSLDVLIVINSINSGSSGEGEAKGEATAGASGAEGEQGLSNPWGATYVLAQSTPGNGPTGRVGARDALFGEDVEDMLFGATADQPRQQPALHSVLQSAIDDVLDDLSQDATQQFAEENEFDDALARIFG
jgi:VCBS repeat-containing protein